MKIDIFTIEESGVTKEQVLSLIKLAFQERKDAGLNYGCLSLSYDGFLREIRDSIILVAIDQDSGVLCGCTVLLIRNTKKGLLYGKEKHTSVHPEYKGHGIGSLLINVLKNKAVEQNCDYLCCSTAVDADSAVKVHLKNGYQIVGLKSFKSTNYYSYLFRMQLKPSQWSDPSFCKKQYKKSARRARIAYKKDGSRTIVGRVLLKVGVKW